MIEKTTKSGSPVGIALVGAFATIAGIGEIVVGLPGNYFGILAHPAGAPLILALRRSNRTEDTPPTSRSEAIAMVAPLEAVLGAPVGVDSFVRC